MKKIVSLLFAVSAIYLNTWAVGIREFSSSDSSTLLNIAIQNPLINGDAVYSARVMLNINPDDYNNSNRMSESDTEEEPVSKNTVYPNPNDGTMSLSYYIDADAELQVVDVVGKIICTYTLFAENSTIEINCQTLNNGIYFYQILSHGNLIES